MAVANFYLSHSRGIIQWQQHPQVGQDWEKWISINVRNPRLTDTQELGEILEVTYSFSYLYVKVLCRQQPGGPDVF